MTSDPLYLVMANCTYASANTSRLFGNKKSLLRSLGNGALCVWPIGWRVSRYGNNDVGLLGGIPAARRKPLWAAPS